jgi:hypothetical protein
MIVVIARISLRRFKSARRPLVIISFHRAMHHFVRYRGRQDRGGKLVPSWLNAARRLDASERIEFRALSTDL